MGYDRQYYTNTKDGFTSCFTEEARGDERLLTRSYAVKEDGDYYLQYYTDTGADVTLLSPSPRYTPIIHSEAYEVKIKLKTGENALRFSVAGEGALYTRLTAYDGRLIRDDIVMPNVPYAQPAPLQRLADTQGYTPAVGAAIPAFGRFGFSKGDGVLDYSMPAFGIIARPFVSGHPAYHESFIWSFSVLPDGETETGGYMTTYQTPDNEKITVDWTHASWQRQLPGGKFIRYDYSTLTPSLLIETDLDYIRLSGLKKLGVYTSATLPLATGMVTKTPDDGILYSKVRDGELTKNFVLLSRQNRFPETPILLTLPCSPEEIIREDDSVTVRFAGAAGFTALTFLYGIELLKTEDLTEEFYKSAIERAETAHRMSLARPETCEEYFMLEDNRIKILDKFGYRILEDSLATAPRYAAPLPPAMLLAAEGVPEIEVDQRPRASMHPTKYGPLYTVADTDYTHYSLPIPEYREPLPFSAKNKEEYTQMLHADFDEYLRYHTDAPEIPNPGNYSFVFQYALVAKLFPYLKEEDRKRLEAEMKKGISVVCNPDYQYTGPNGRRCLSWYERTDPFSKISYYSTYLHIGGINTFHHCDRELVENAEKVFIEIDWGNAMSLYGTWLGALLCGAFDELNENFHVIRRAFDYYLVNMDFACMCAGYAENGTLWNDGTGYGGFLGFVNIADALGRQQDVELGLYAYAKMCCMRQGMFLSSQNYFCKYFGVEPWYVTKFFHEETDGSCGFTSYPEDIVRNHYRKEGLYNLTTEGHYKEAFRMYAAYLPEEVKKLLSAAEGSLEVSVSGPTDWDLTYHAFKNGILSQQETYTYLCLCHLTGRFSTDELRQMINDAAENNRMSREMLGHPIWSHRRVPKEWTRLSLLTELDGENEAHLTAWRGLRIAEAAYPELTVEHVTGSAWLEIYSQTAPHAQLNGKELPFCAVRSNIYRTEIAENGTIVFL